MGESHSTTTSIYNLSALACTGLGLGIVRPEAPSSWLPIVAVGVLSAFRLAILARAATSTEQSARVFVLSNLTFVWLSIGREITHPDHALLGTIGILILLSGCAVAYSRENRTSV